MAKKLYVGNLPYTVTDESLKDLFSEVGTVISANVITCKLSGRSKGFGFVEMEDEDADKAVSALNGKEVEGRQIVVDIARPMKPRDTSYNNRRGRSWGSRRDYDN